VFEKTCVTTKKSKKREKSGFWILKKTLKNVRIVSRHFKKRKKSCFWKYENNVKYVFSNTAVRFK